jgi:uncharacterized membrane protein
VGRARRRALWLAWLVTLLLLVVFIASIVYYNRGIDTVAVLIALIAQLIVVIAWALYRPLPLWIPAGHGLILLSAVVGLLIAAPAGHSVTTLGGIALSWTLIGLVPAGIVMILAAVMHRQPAMSLTH